MNPTLINFHQNRYEWAFKAKQEFINGFIGLDEWLRNKRKLGEFSTVSELTFSQLAKVFKESEEVTRLKLEQHQEKLKKYGELIERQKILLNHVIKEEERYDEICSELKQYDLFLNKMALKDTSSNYIFELVNHVIVYMPNNRKASFINQNIEDLEQQLKEDIEPKLREIIQEADGLNIGTTALFQLPYYSPIPRIEQKIDTFWLKSSYEKAVNQTREFAYDWVTKMYHSYNEVLLFIQNEAIERREQLSKEKNAIHFATTEKRKKLEQELAEMEQLRAQHDVHSLEVYEQWNISKKHVSQLQGYFIKHWMEYMEELKQLLLKGNTQERWLASQYLGLLRQDGEKMIKSLN
ncbi:hypothetical protein [Neobacillus dielmonensis]|uniref:hypothetical protein n=1 Tax=Neobacillus dielmonensis TaxID=1347369 RepID=UPI0005A97C54|nr:hypothetical protein [Neobacillus dielmonensis]